MNLKKFISVLLCFAIIIVSTGIVPVYAVEEKENYTKVLYDFEYVTGEENKEADNYIASYTLPTYSATWLTENENGGYSTRTDLAKALYEQDIPLYMWPNAGAKDHNNTTATATVVSSADGEPVRSGDKSLRIDFDLSNFDKSRNANFYLRTTTPAYKFEGSPTAIGCWVYAPEGTTAYHLYLQCAGKVIPADNNGAGSGVGSYQCLTTPEAMGNDSKGISWTGWRYLEFDLTGTKGNTGVSYVGGAYEPYGQKTDNGVFWISYQPSNMGTDVTTDTIYIDNITLIYGDSDKIPPEVLSVKANGNELVDNAVIEKTYNGVTFSAEFCDKSISEYYEEEIEAVDMYINNVCVTEDCEITDTSIEYTVTDLPIGLNTLKIDIFDIYGNKTEVIKNFTIVADNTPPEISVFKVNDKELVDKKTILFSENIELYAEFNDDISENSSFDQGIASVELYVDGIFVNSDAEITDSVLTYKTVLSEGIHTVKLNVYDIYSNMATTERMFTVVLNLPEEPETKPEEPTTDPDNNSGEDEEDSSEQTEIMNNLTEFFNKIKDFIAKIADFFKAFMKR